MTRLKIDEDGYIIHTHRNSEGGWKSGPKRIMNGRNWWLGKPNFNLNIPSLPKQYWGERIRIRIEIMDEIITQELVGGRKNG